jgi:hypothetical protein
MKYNPMRAFVQSTGRKQTFINLDYTGTTMIMKSNTLFSSGFSRKLGESIENNLYDNFISKLNHPNYCGYLQNKL